MSLRNSRLAAFLCAAMLAFSPVPALADEAVLDEVPVEEQETPLGEAEVVGETDGTDAEAVGDAAEPEADDAGDSEGDADAEDPEGEVGDDALEGDGDTDADADAEEPESLEPQSGEQETAKPAITRRGWNRGEDGSWYWSTDGKSAATGWVWNSGSWYYLDPATSRMREGEAFEVGGKTYVASASGACPASSWVRAGGKWYLTDGSCAARSGWVWSGGSWYYLDPSTRAMKENESFQIGGKTYVASASGACPASSWVRAGGKWYLTDGSCAARSGWVVFDNVEVDTSI